MNSTYPRCISSNVCSPHPTRRFGSGFAGFPAELSYHAVYTTRSPRRTGIGVAAT